MEVEGCHAGRRYRQDRQGGCGDQKEQLTAFLEAPEIPISNSLAENAIRPFVLGRKNWLFCDSVKGAESSAIVYSLVETAKANGVEPYEIPAACAEPPALLWQNAVPRNFGASDALES